MVSGATTLSQTLLLKFPTSSTATTTRAITQATASNSVFIGALSARGLFQGQTSTVGRVVYKVLDAPGCIPFDKRNSLQGYKERRVPGAKNLSMGGGSVLPHPVVAASEVRGASTTSRLEDGDGVVIVDHGSRRAESNAMLHEFVKMYKEETGHKLVEVAHMELATPTIADAFDRCVEQGASRVIICPYFFFPGRHWDKDIPALAAEAARKHPQVSYLVTAPIGLHKLMVTVIQDRMEYCLSQTAGEVAECDMCKGTGRCKLSFSPESQVVTDALGGSVGTLTR